MNKMTNSNLPLSKNLIELIEKNSDSLAIKLRNNLEENDKLSHYEVDDIYPLLYNSLIKELLEHFETFNKSEIYTKEIESGKYCESDKRNYYDCLILDTVSKLMVFRDSKKM